MTNNIENSRILDRLISSDFDEAFELARQTQITWDELIVLYQKSAPRRRKVRKPSLFKSADFWNSKLPFFHLDKVLSSPLRVPFWTGYFSNDNFCNDELSEYLWHLAKDEFVRQFKLSWGFKHPNFIQSIQKVGKNNQAADIFHNDLKWILKEHGQICSEERADNAAILQYTFGDVLMGYALEYYAVKQDKGVEGNKERQTAIEIALIEDLDRIMKEFSLGKNEIIVPFDSNEELQQAFESNRVRHKWLKPESRRVQTLAKYAQISWLIKRAVNRKIRTSDIERYLSGYADIESVGSKFAIVTNHLFTRFQRNDYKGWLEEFYINGEHDVEKPVARNSVKASLKTFEFYGFPSEFKFPENKFTAQNLLQLLKDFSVFKGPHERQFLFDPDTKEFRHVHTWNNPPQSFARLFGSNESISLFDYKELMQRIGKYYQWEDHKARFLLSFLTLDLDKELPTQWIWRPFLKVGDKVILLGSFMKDRRWENLMLNRFKYEKEPEGIIRQLSAGFEEVIRKAFDEQGFITKAGHRFKNSLGETGEVDALAYKDGYLFVIEAKQGRRSNDFSYAADIESNKLDGQATEQLLKIERYITMDWDALKEEWPALRRRELSRTRIILLIVTDGFEADRIEFTNGVRKISFLELKVLLSNTKEKLFKDYLKMAEARSGRNPDFDEEALKEMKELEWDLWDGQSEVQGDTLCKRIDENAVWKEYESLWRF